MEGYWRDLRFLFGTKLQVLLLRVVVIYVHNRREWYVSLFSVVPHRHRSLVWLCRLLVPQPEIPPTPNAVEAQSLKHWTTREVPGLLSSEDSKNADVRIFYHPNSLTPWVEEFYVDPGQGPRFGVLLMWTGSTGITASTASRISTPHQTQVSESTFQQKSLSYLCAHRNLTSHAKQMFSEVKATENCVLEQDWKGLAANLFLSISLPFITSFLRWRTVEPGGDVGTMAAADIVSVRPWGPPSGGKGVLILSRSWVVQAGSAPWGGGVSICPQLYLGQWTLVNMLQGEDYLDLRPKSSFPIQVFQHENSNNALSQLYLFN